MPCSKYKSKAQKELCYLTDEWSDWSKVKYKSRYKKGGHSRTKDSVIRP